VEETLWRLKRKLFILNVVARLTLKSSGSCQKRCEETGVSKVVASETEEALKALQILDGTKIQIIVVTHYPAETWSEGRNIPISLRRKECAEIWKSCGWWV